MRTLSSPPQPAAQGRQAFAAEQQQCQKDRGEGVKDVFGYFNNYYAGHAPASARTLQRLLGQTPVEPGEVGEQTTLF